MPTDIAFLPKGIAFKLTHPKKSASWLVAIAEEEGRKIESLTYVFASDAFVAKMNKEYLHHDTYTDILTFDYSEGSDIIGEIYISIPRVRENARTFKQPFDSELRRVMAHGLLHILGYKDKSAKQLAEMRRKEEACLSLWQ